MPKDLAVAHNYTEALLQGVKKFGIPLETAQLEARELRDLLNMQPKLRTFLYGPQFREEDKEEVAREVFSRRISEIFFRFIVLLLRRDRIEHLQDILEFFDDRIEEMRGMTPCTVTTAVPLNETDQQEFKVKLEKYCGRKFDIRFKVDARILGGVKVRYGDTLMDTTIATYLTDLHRRLTETRLAS